MLKKRKRRKSKEWTASGQLQPTECTPNDAANHSVIFAPDFTVVAVVCVKDSHQICVDIIQEWRWIRTSQSLSSCLTIVLSCWHQYSKQQIIH